MFTHFVFGSDDPNRAERFYQAVLPLLGFRRLDGGGAALLFDHGDGLPQVVVPPSAGGRPVRRGNGYHVAFHARDEATVQRFHAAALENGGSDEGSPGLRPHYAPDYYGAYVRDPAGNKLQAVTYRNGRTQGPGGDIVSHITIGTANVPAAGVFYEAVLATLGLARLPVEESEDEDRAFGHAGRALPIVFAQRTFDGKPPAPSLDSFAVLRAPDRDAVVAFYEQGLRRGGRPLAAPAESADAGPRGYGAAITDPEGNPLCACCPTRSWS